MEISTMKKRSSQKIGVRQYKKSSVPRLRWTPELHELFIEAVQHLGGGHKATPKRIQQMMAVEGLKFSHVKSHLQMYRNLKERTSTPNNFHEDRPQISWSSSLQHVSETLEYPSKSSKQEAQGSLSSGMTKEEDDGGGQISEICECEREINFWPLDDHQNSQSNDNHKLHSTKDNSHINLDLSLSSCFYC